MSIVDALLSAFSGLLYHLTDAITKTISLDRQAGSNPQFLNVLTRPLTHRIIQVECRSFPPMPIHSDDSWTRK